MQLEVLVAALLLISAQITPSFQDDNDDNKEFDMDRLMDEKWQGGKDEAISCDLSDEGKKKCEPAARLVDAINERCKVVKKIDISTMEPDFGLLKQNGDIVWMNNAATDEEIINSGFQMDKYTTVLIPGFTQHMGSPWIKDAKQLIIDNGHAADDNYMFMRWASNGGYPEIAARTRPMGQELARFLTRLADLGADRMKMHLIGHSISTHVASFAGKNMDPKIGRITGVDPAGPCFGKWLNKDVTHDRLTLTDAYQVDVSHYDDKFLGIPGNVGQFDMVVNGGWKQPGCPGPTATAIRCMNTALFFNMHRNLSPAHTRSASVATQQLTGSQCMHVAYECQDYETFLRGECGECDKDNSQCFWMGFPFQYKEHVDFQPLRQAPAPGRKFHIVIDDNKNLCSNHYQILVEFDESPDRFPKDVNKWKLSLHLQYEGGKFDVKLSNRWKDNVFSHLLTNELPPHKITGAMLKVNGDWNKSIKVHGWDVDAETAKNSYRVKSIQVNFMSHVQPEVRQQYSVRLCPVKVAGDDKQKVRFDPCE